MGKARKSKVTRKSKREEQPSVSVEEARESVIREIRQEGCDGETFASNLEASMKNKTKRGKLPRRIRYLEYCNWAYALVRNNVGPPDAQFGFPSSVLTFIRALVPGDIVGEIREDVYTVSMAEFCQALDLPRQQ